MTIDHSIHTEIDKNCGLEEDLMRVLAQRSPLHNVCVSNHEAIKELLAKDFVCGAVSLTM